MTRSNKPAGKRIIKSRYYKRLFLNDRRGLAALETDVEAHSYIWHTKKGRQRKGFSLSGDLSLADCGRRISLELTAGYDKKGRPKHRKVLRKISRIIDTALAIRAFIVAAADKHRTWKPPRIAAKKRRSGTPLEGIE